MDAEERIGVVGEQRFSGWQCKGPLAAGVLPILMVHDLMGAAKSLPCRRVTVRGPVQFTWILGGISQGAGPVKH